MAKFNNRRMEMHEQKYTYSMNEVSPEEIGLIGYLRGDFDSGYTFHHTWWTVCESLRTREFVAEFDELFEKLRSGMLKDRKMLRKQCREEELLEWEFYENLSNYGMKVSSEHYVYYFRFAPFKGNYDVCCYAYSKEILERYQLEESTRIALQGLLVNQKNGSGVDLLLCPRCGKPKIVANDVAMNAYSRYEDIYICSDCGREEAFKPLLPLHQWNYAKRCNPKHDFKPSEIPVGRELIITDDGKSIEAYLCTGFDVEEKLEVRLVGDDYVNLYATYTPATKDLTMAYTLVYADNREDGGGVYKPSQTEKDLIISMIEEECCRKGYDSAQAYISSVTEN